MVNYDVASDLDFELFEEGVKLSRECGTQLNEAEQKVKLLLGLDDDGNPVTGEFAAQEN